MADKTTSKLRSTATTLESPFAPYIPCQLTGRCFNCKAGRSGRSKDGVSAPTPNPAGPATALVFAGAATSARSSGGFHPHIYVNAVRRMPSSVAIAAMTGGGLRTYDIPVRILDRSIDRQRGWVSRDAEIHARS